MPGCWRCWPSCAANLAGVAVAAAVGVAVVVVAVAVEDHLNDNVHVDGAPASSGAVEDADLTLARWALAAAAQQGSEQQP